MDLGIKNKVALLTGASSGLGFASALDILFAEKQDNDNSLAELERLFLTSPTCTRSHRSVPRTYPSDRHLLLYATHSKKSCF